MDVGIRIELCYIESFTERNEAPSPRSESEFQCIFQFSTPCHLLYCYLFYDLFTRHRPDQNDLID